MLDGLDVMLAEDNLTNQMVAVQMLEALGARVAVANDGAEALDILEHRTFDVMLIDIEMPRLSGTELIRRLRASGGPHSGVPMIALTAYVMQDHRAAILAAGADGIIAKPIMSIDGFGAEIRSIAERRRRVCGVGSEDAGAEPAAADSIDPGALAMLERAVGAGAFTEIVGKAIDDLERVGHRLARGLASGEAAEVRQASHQLIGLAGAVGARGLVTLARRLEAAEDGPWPPDAACVLETGLDAALAHLRQARCNDAA